MSEMGEVLKILENVRDKQDRGTERMHEKMDTIVEGQNAIETRLSLVEVAMPVLPCDFGVQTKKSLTSHIDEHAETKKMVNRSVIASVVSLAFGAFAWLIAWLIAKLKGVI